MSIESWKKEYYPIDAGAQCNETLHSLRKWTGLRSEALKAHGLKQSGPVIYDEPTNIFRVASDTCALCVKYFDSSSTEPCDLCPLSKVRGDVRCDSRRLDEPESPYCLFVKHGNPEPMILWLKMTVRYEQGRLIAIPNNLRPVETFDILCETSTSDDNTEVSADIDFTSDSEIFDSGPWLPS
jgi:hypothetical protein